MNNTVAYQSVNSNSSGGFHSGHRHTLQVCTCTYLLAMYAVTTDQYTSSPGADHQSDNHHENIDESSDNHNDGGDDVQDGADDKGIVDDINTL